MHVQLSRSAELIIGGEGFIAEEWTIIIPDKSGFGGLEVAYWPLVPKFKPGRSRRIIQGEKNPQHAFLRKGSKPVCPVPHICGM